MKWFTEIRAGLCVAGGGGAAVTVLFALWLAVGTMPVVAQDAPAKEPETLDLRLFYQQNCAGCHGADGSARNADGKKLSGQDLTDQRWLKGASDKGMVKTILKGKFFGWAMPGYGDKLTQDEAQRMVTDIIRKSEKGKPIAPASAPGE